MYRLATLLVCVFLCGCVDPSARAPMLTLKLERQDGTSHSIGRYRVFSTGVLSESSDRDDSGRGESQRLTIDKIVDDGVTLTFEMSDRSGEGFRQSVLLRYGEETKVDLPNQATLVAKLEANQ